MHPPGQEDTPADWYPDPENASQGSPEQQHINNLKPDDSYNAVYEDGSGIYAPPNRRS